MKLMLAVNYWPLPIWRRHLSCKCCFFC